MCATEKKVHVTLKLNMYMHPCATPSRFTQQIVLKLILRAEEIGLFPHRSDMKLSSTESGSPKIRWHSFKEQIKENTLKRKFHYSTWTDFHAKSNSLFSRAQFTFPFDFPFRLIFRCAVQNSHSGTWQCGWERFVTWNATMRKEEREGGKKKEPPASLSLFPRGWEWVNGFPACTQTGCQDAWWSPPISWEQGEVSRFEFSGRGKAL